MQIISRKEARIAGLPHYFTGKPCCHGHIAERMTSQKHCLACHRERRAYVRRTQAEKVKRQKADSYQRHRDAVIANVAAYQSSRPEWNRARQQRYRDRKKATVAH